MWNILAMLKNYKLYISLSPPKSCPIHLYCLLFPKQDWTLLCLWCVFNPAPLSTRYRIPTERGVGGRAVEHPKSGTESRVLHITSWTQQKTCWKCTLNLFINRILCNIDFYEATWNNEANYSSLVWNEVCCAWRKTVIVTQIEMNLFTFSSYMTESSSNEGAFFNG